MRSSATTDQASSDFRDAIALLDHGDNREADAALTRFLARYLRDPRSEDAAYLRVIALQRCGDAPIMKQAARAYLRRYPSGLRRADVERLLGDTAE
jgi:TolA-binding protein